MEEGGGGSFSPSSSSSLSHGRDNGRPGWVTTSTHKQPAQPPAMPHKQQQCMDDSQKGAHAMPSRASPKVPSFLISPHILQCPFKDGADIED